MPPRTGGQDILFPSEQSECCRVRVAGSVLPGPCCRVRVATSDAQCAASCYKRSVDKTIRVYASHKKMKADEYRYRQSRPVHERMSAVAEITGAAYATKHQGRDVRRLQGTPVCLQRPPR